MRHRLSSFVGLLSCLGVLGFGGLAGCSSSGRSQELDATAVAATVIAQITATAESLTLPTKIAATVIAQLDGEAPTPTPGPSASREPTRASTSTRGPTNTPQPTNTPLPTPTPVYGTLKHPAPLGITLTLKDIPRRSDQRVMAVTVLDVVRGAQAARLRSQSAGYSVDLVKGQEHVAVKVRIEILTNTNRQAVDRISVSAHFALCNPEGDYLSEWDTLYSAPPWTIKEGYAPISGEGWVFFGNRIGEPLPLLYFFPDQGYLREFYLAFDGVYFSLEDSQVAAPSPNVQAQGSLQSQQSGPVARAKSNCNLRSGPGTDYPIVGSLSQGAEAKITGKDRGVAQWWQVSTANGGRAWVSAQLVDVRNVGDVPPVTVDPAPTKPAGVSVAPSGQNWVLVADSRTDWPGGPDHNNWYYLWTDGRNNFAWQDMRRASSGCYQDPGNHGLELCQDSIKADPRGDVGVQWKASRGGTYRFEWDTPLLKFYKHATFVGSQGKGSELPYAATIEGVIDWEMFFWVAQANTNYHIRVYKLEQ